SRNVASFGVKRGASAAAAQGGEPADRIPVGRAAVEAEGDQLSSAAEIFPGNGAAKAAIGEREAAVGAVVAIVAHQEDVAVRNGDARKIVADRIAEVDRVIETAVWQGLAEDRQPAIRLAVIDND